MEVVLKNQSDAHTGWSEELTIRIGPIHADTIPLMVTVTDTNQVATYDFL